MTRAGRATGDEDRPDVLTWQQHMEALVIGAVRGMAEAHSALKTPPAAHCRR